MRIPVLTLTLATVGSALLARPISAQATSAAPTAATAPGAVLTLADAVALARRNNPGFASSTNARRNAAAIMRAANGAFLPSVNSSFGAGYREGRQTFFQGQAFGATNDQLSTDVSASASLNVSVGAINDRRQARFNQEATETDISAAEQRLRTDVTTQYLAALQAQARSVLQDTLVTTTTAQLQLARARLQVGSGTQLDVSRAEVADGQQRVAAINARNQAAIEIVRLFQLIGVPSPGGTRLDPNLGAAPTVELQSILEMAKKSNPQLEGLRLREEGFKRAVASARGSYFPSLSLQASLSAFTNRYTNTGQLITSGQLSSASSKASCIRSEEVRAALGLSNSLSQCNAIAFTPAQEQDIRDQQGKYPFDFTRNPYSLSASLSLPVFNGFRREQQVEQATVQRRNAANDLRTQELKVTADVTAAFLSLTTSQQTVALQEQNVATARTVLALAQERYRVGAISLVELVQARGDFEKAETDRINAVYDVQRAFTALEAAVGRPLR
jgi:outer membrane protein